MCRMCRLTSLSGRILATAFVAALALPVSAHSGDWIEPTPEELASTHGRVDPGADAEALLWEVTVDDRPDGRPEDTILDYYLRVKIFTAAGAEKFSTVPLFYSRDAGISLVRARSVAPDGTRSTLAQDAVFKTTVAKTGDTQLNSTSFAIPNVRPGAIVEYRYRETRFNQFAHFLSLPLQLDIPVVLVRYSIRPFLTTTLEMHHIVFNATISPFEHQTQGFYSTSARDLPAFVEEPFMPAEDDVRGTLLIYYAPDRPKSADRFWQEIGKEGAIRFDGRTRPDKAIRDLAARLHGNGPADVDGLRRLFDWCRQNIDNRSNDELEGRAPAEERPRPNDDAAAVLDHRSGTAEDINLLFASLARAAGFDVRLAAAASRSRRQFDPSLMIGVFLETPLIAVRLGSAWTLFDPGVRTASFGALRWQHEGTLALLCDRNESGIVETPRSDPRHNVQLRTAHLKLTRDGLVEGDVHEVLTGQINSARRRLEADESLAQREKEIVDRLRVRLPTAEVESVSVATDLPDTTLRYEESFHLRIPDYATRTGKRLLLQPSVFQKDPSPLFVASQRRYPVCFPYSWTDVDSVEIELPPGVAVEDAGQPKPLDIPGIGHYAASVKLSGDGRRIVYVRSLRFGDNGTICFPRESYGDLKALFEAVHEADAITLTLFDSGDTE